MWGGIHGFAYVLIFYATEGVLARFKIAPSPHVVIGIPHDVGAREGSAPETGGLNILRGTPPAAVVADFEERSITIFTPAARQGRKAKIICTVTAATIPTTTRFQLRPGIATNKINQHRPL